MFRFATMKDKLPARKATLDSTLAKGAQTEVLIFPKEMLAFGASCHSRGFERNTQPSPQHFH
jgi:hypothetical protein